MFPAATNNVVYQGEALWKPPVFEDIVVSLRRHAAS
jgi:hypothetical protein